jgi:hypothetical protein
MAYKKDPLEEDGAPIGGAGVIAGNSAGGGTTQAAPASTGSGWTNLNKYLEMNKGQTGGLSDSFIGNNQKTVDKAIGSDLVKATKEDSQWSEPINKATNLSNEIRTGDVSNVDPTKFKSVLGSNYNKPQSFNQLEGYKDVLGNFSKAADRIDNIQDYGSQKATLTEEFTKDYTPYNSGMGTLDTFLLRGDKEASARTREFQEANRQYGSTRDESGNRTPGISQAFQNKVVNPLTSFFDSQESAFNTAKGDLTKAVGDRRTAIERSVTPEMIAARRNELAASNPNLVNEYITNKNISTNSRDDLGQFLSSRGTLDEADLLSDSDWQTLAALEALDGSRSRIQDQQRGDFSTYFDSEAADTWWAENNPVTYVPEAPPPVAPYGTAAEKDWQTTNPQESGGSYWNRLLGGLRNRFK